MSDTESKIIVRRPPGSLGLRLLRCGCFANEPGSHPPGVVHGSWVAYIVSETGMAISCHRGRSNLRPGACWVVPPWLPVTYHLRRPIDHAYLVFDTDALPAAPVRRFFDRVHRCSDPLPGELLSQLARRIADLGSDDIRLGARALAIAHLAFDDCLAALPPEQRRQIIHRRDIDDISPALDHIERHLDRSIAVADLAELLGVSERHCGNLFRRHCDCTPMDYVCDRRIRRACSLLADSDEHIEQIARRCGFPNRHYFSRVFAKRMGCPPATYRRGHRGHVSNSD